MKLSDEEEEGKIAACQLESEENEEENKMVTIAVTIDEELLRRLDEASLHLGEEGLHFIKERETGELQNLFKCEHERWFWKRAFTNYLSGDDDGNTGPVDD